MTRPILMPCEYCQSEGRILTNNGGPDDTDHGECPVCEGTGSALVESEGIEMDDLDEMAGTDCRMCGAKLYQYPCFERQCPWPNSR